MPERSMIWNSLTKGFLFWSEIGYIGDMAKKLREEHTQNSRLVKKCDEITRRIEEIPITVSVIAMQQFALNGV